MMTTALMVIDKREQFLKKLEAIEKEYPRQTIDPTLYMREEPIEDTQ